MLRLATVGTSGITEKFLAACRLSGRYILTTAYSRDKEKGAAFAKNQGFLNSCTNLTELAKSPDIDAVYIATPNVFHFEQSKLFLENGKHVLCEKPIVTNADEYSELLSLAEKNGLIYMEAIMSMHCKGHEILHGTIGEIGRISQARIDFCQRSSRYDSFSAGEKVNIFDMSLAAGTLMDLGVYCVYAAVDLFGNPENVTAMSGFLHNGADSCGSAVLQYNNFLATLSYSKIGQSAIGSEIVGDSGVIKVGSVSQYADISLVKDGKETLLLGLLERSEIMRGEADKFADYIENFGEFKDDYLKNCKLTQNVHFVMDLIKQKANIKYPIKEQ